jgi:hypothetical protein
MPSWPFLANGETISFVLVSEVLQTENSAYAHYTGIWLTSVAAQSRGDGVRIHDAVLHAWVPPVARTEG